MKRTFLLPVAIALVVLLSACQNSSPASGGAMLSERQRKEILAFSEPKMDSLLAGWNADDYAAFSRDFSEETLKSISPQQFEKLRNDEFTGLGRFFSREIESVVQQSDGSYTVFYYAVFENNDELLLRAKFQPEEPHLISGLSFNK